MRSLFIQRTLRVEMLESAELIKAFLLCLLGSSFQRFSRNVPLGRNPGAGPESTGNIIYSLWPGNSITGQVFLGRGKCGFTSTTQPEISGKKINELMDANVSIPPSSCLKVFISRIFVRSELLR